MKENIENKLKSSGFLFDDEHKIWYLGTQEFFNYSDGDEAESYIYDIFNNIENYENIEIEVEDKIKNWESLYHLSSQRTKLIAPFIETFENKIILEIGCGCGALTRYLGINSKLVVAIEGSYRRASITSKRCKDLDNVLVICCNSRDLPEFGLFDTVLLIGVLEYAKKYLGDKGEILLLESCRNQIKDSGNVFIAIENKIGVKYLAGANEDHYNQAMIGINRQYPEKNICTYGKVELIKKIQKAGYNDVLDYYPFPDYKFPNLVISGDLLKKYSNFNIVRDMIVQSLNRDPQLEHVKFNFSLESMVENLFDNEIVDNFSNSFLFIASKQIEPNKVTGLWYYSFLRKSKFSKYFKIIENLDNLYILNSYKNIDSIEIGKNYWNSLISVINKKNWSYDDLLNYFLVWYKILCDQVKLDYTCLFNSKVSNKYLEALPFNLIINDIDHVFIDLDEEYIEEGCVEIGYLFYRAVFHSLARVSSVEDSCYIKNVNLHDICSEVIKSFYKNISQTKCDEYLKKEIEILNKISISETSFSLLKNIKIKKRIYTVEYFNRFNNIKFLLKLIVKLVCVKFLKLRK